jgi:hypothetical protein
MVEEGSEMEKRRLRSKLDGEGKIRKRMRCMSDMCQHKMASHAYLEVSSTR